MLFKEEKMKIVKIQGEDIAVNKIISYAKSLMGKGIIDIEELEEK
jgi:hypothetical protein